jgi:hypothetical protein
MVNLSGFEGASKLMVQDHDEADSGRAQRGQAMLKVMIDWKKLDLRRACGARSKLVVKRFLAKTTESSQGGLSDLKGGASRGGK